MPSQREFPVPARGSYHACSHGPVFIIFVLVFVEISVSSILRAKQKRKIHNYALKTTRVSTFFDKLSSFLEAISQAFLVTTLSVLPLTSKSSTSHL